MPTAIADPNHELLTAAIDKDWAHAQACLDAGADINRRVAINGMTPLILMASRGDAAACTWLVQKGANVTARTKTGESAMHFALQSENPTQIKATVEALIEAGAPFDLPSNLGVRPLQEALSSRHGTEMARVLIERGADLNAASHLGTTPPMAAATFGKGAELLLMLEKGAGVETVTHDGKTLLHAIIEGEQPELLAEVLALTPRSLVNKAARSGTTPLALAAIRANLVGMVDLLEAGADPNVRSGNGLEDGNTPLMLLTTVRRLPRALNRALDDRPATPPTPEEARAKLEALIATGIAIAVKAGAIVDDTNDWGERALFFAASTGNWKALEQLVLLGADPKGPLDRCGLSPYTCALVLYLNQSSKADKAKREKLKEEMLATFKLLHGLGFPLEAPVAPGPRRSEAKPDPSALEVAYKNQLWEAADALIALGAKPDALAPSGATPLHALAEASLSNLQMTAISLRQNALATQQQQAPSPAAAGGVAPAAVPSAEDEVRKLLASVNTLQQGALERLAPGSFDPNALNAQGETVLAVAAARGNQPLVGGLLARGADPLAAGPSAEHALSAALTSGQVEVFHGLWARIKEQPEVEDLLVRAAYTSPETYRERQVFLDLVVSMGPGPWLEAKDADGNTPLIVAAATMQEDLVDVLLGMGANPDARNHIEETASMHAAEQGKGDILRSLRGAGADVSLCRTNGETVTDIVRRSRDDYLQRALTTSELPPPSLRVPPDGFKARQDEGTALWPMPGRTRSPKP